MILKLWDKTEYQLSAEEAGKVGAMIDNGADWIVFGAERIKVSAIAKIIKGGTGQAILDNTKLLADKRTATDEGIAKAREKLLKRMDTPIKAKKERTERKWA